MMKALLLGSGMTGIRLGLDAITGLGGVLDVRVRYEIFLSRKADARRTRFERGLETEFDAGWRARRKTRAPKLER